MKNTLETESETSDKNDGCPKISHTAGAGVKGRSPVLMGGAEAEPLDAASAAPRPPGSCSGAKRAQSCILGTERQESQGLVPRLALTCGTDFS